MKTRGSRRAVNEKRTVVAFLVGESQVSLQEEWLRNRPSSRVASTPSHTEERVVRSPRLTPPPLKLVTLVGRESKGGHEKAACRAELLKRWRVRVAHDFPGDPLLALRVYSRVVGKAQAKPPGGASLGTTIMNDAPSGAPMAPLPPAPGPRFGSLRGASIRRGVEWRETPLRCFANDVPSVSPARHAGRSSDSRSKHILRWGRPKASRDLLAEYDAHIAAVRRNHTERRARSEENPGRSSE